MSRKPLKKSFNQKPSEQEVEDFLSAAYMGATGVIEKLLKKYGTAIINKKGDTGRTALMIAAWTGHKDIVGILLKNDAEVNEKDSDDNTALILAAFSGRRGIAEKLLKKGADIEAVDGDGMTALICAADKNNPDVVILLLKNGADPDKRDKNGKTALMLAEKFKNLKVKKLLKTWPEMQKQRKLAAITKSIMGGLSRPLPYKPFRFPQQGGEP